MMHEENRVEAPLEEEGITRGSLPPRTLEEDLEAEPPLRKSRTYDDRSFVILTRWMRRNALIST